MKHIFINWKTTGAGITAIITGLVHFAATKDISALIISISAGAGLILSKDATTI